jgi:REP element-mobilizing transposase RayT
VVDVTEYRKSAHTLYSLHYHFVFIPKYRKPVLRVTLR